MADSAFKSASFPGLTTAELRQRADRIEAEGDKGNIVSLMRAEIARREAVAAGDVSQMTDGERLRFARSAKARA